MSETLNSGGLVHASLSAERQATILTWMHSLPPRDRQRSIDGTLRAGGAEADFVRWVLSKESRSRGASPADKASAAPQTK